MSRPEVLQKERLALRDDLVNHRIPKRVPIFLRFSADAACGLAGVDLMRAHYDLEQLERAYETLCDTFYSDCNPISGPRYPASYQLLGAHNWVLSSTGVMQHPEIEVMRPDEYDEYIDAPYATLVEKLLPRVCTALESDSASRMLIFARAYDSYLQAGKAHGALMRRIGEKYGYCPGMTKGGKVAAPFDFIADQLRGFRGILLDIRKCPDKVERAAQATLPLMVRLGTPARVQSGATHFCPLHLAPYMNTSAFERFWWPTYRQMCEELDAIGVGVDHYCEQDFTRYAEYLARLPKSNSFRFEDGDYRHIKETAGKDHVIGGFFDPMITLTKSAPACIDEAKRLLDACMEGGKFYFAFDKNIIDIKSVNVHKLAAVVEWVRQNAVY